VRVIDGSGMWWVGFGLRGVGSKGIDVVDDVCLRDELRDGDRQFPYASISELFSSQVKS
jgi:hypothetical protein